jgi:prephenate dehydratase
MEIKELTYLGPEGTYTQQIAEMRFGDTVPMHPASTIFNACEYVKNNFGAYAVVPIENSSGGSIMPTIDILLNEEKLSVVEYMTLVVRLALLGSDKEKIKHIYSHFAPFKHCAGWLKKNFPDAQYHEVSSTAEGAIRAQDNPEAAVLGSVRLAKYYNVKVLEYPIEQDIVNETEFVLITNTDTNKGNDAGEKTSLAVELKNGPGSLCSFLIPFKDEGVNLTRIISRPVYGVPSEYAFYIDIKGNKNDKSVMQALEAASTHCDSLRIIGSYKFAGKFYS